MPITVASLTSGSSSANATSYATASITPSANRLIVLAVEQNLPALANPVVPPTATGNGLTWVSIASDAAPGHWVSGSQAWSRTTLFRAMGASPSTGAVTLDFGAVTQDSVAWSIVEFDGVDTSGANGSGAVVQSATGQVPNSGTALTVTLGAFGSADNATYGAFGSGRGDAAAITFTPGTGFTELHDTGVEFAFVATQWRVDNDTTVDTTLSVAGDGIGGVAIEIRAAAGGATARSRGFNLQQMADDAEDEGRFNELDVRNWWKVGLRPA